MMYQQENIFNFQILAKLLFLFTELCCSNVRGFELVTSCFIIHERFVTLHYDGLNSDLLHLMYVPHLIVSACCWHVFAIQHQPPCLLRQMHHCHTIKEAEAKQSQTFGSSLLL